MVSPIPPVHPDPFSVGRSQGPKGNRGLKPIQGLLPGPLPEPSGLYAPRAYRVRGPDAPTEPVVQAHHHALGFGRVTPMLAEEMGLPGGHIARRMPRAGDLTQLPVPRQPTPHPKVEELLRKESRTTAWGTAAGEHSDTVSQLFPKSQPPLGNSGGSALAGLHLSRDPQGLRLMHVLGFHCVICRFRIFPGDSVICLSTLTGNSG